MELRLLAIEQVPGAAQPEGRLVDAPLDRQVQSPVVPTREMDRRVEGARESIDPFDPGQRRGRALERQPRDREPPVEVSILLALDVDLDREGRVPTVDEDALRLDRDRVREPVAIRHEIEQLQPEDLGRRVGRPSEVVLPADRAVAQLDVVGDPEALREVGGCRIERLEVAQQAFGEGELVGSLVRQPDLGQGRSLDVSLHIAHEREVGSFQDQGVQLEAADQQPEQVDPGEHAARPEHGRLVG